MGISKIPPSPEVESFLTTTSGIHNIQKTALSSYQSTYIAYVKKEIEILPNETFTELLQRDDNAPVSTNEVFTFLNEVATCMKNKHHVSIDSIARDLLKNGVLVPGCAEGDLHARARRLLFTSIAWFTMLYPPLPVTDSVCNQLEIDGDQAACLVTSQPVENCSRPICELMRDFGQLLPTKREETAPVATDSVFTANSLYVSLLNAATLYKIGAVQIQWVNNISSHLVFDPESKHLMIFCLPSFCEVNRFENTSLARSVAAV